MAKGYFELRKQSARGTESVIADMMRHLHTRQHLGKALIVCEHPAVVLSTARKQWLKLSRIIQKQRAGTLNADKILKYTHTIAHMQHMRFSVKSPLEDPEADIYFLRASQLTIMPPQCLTIYAITKLPDNTVVDMLSQLPADCLVVDYGHITSWCELGLQPKAILEEQVISEWQQTERFLAGHDINVKHLFDNSARNIDAMDDALDTLLGVSQKFLHVASDFQRALELARPLRMSKDIRKQYDALSLLGHRVQALMPGAFTQHFLEVYNEDDGFFLYDQGKKQSMSSGETLHAAITRHRNAGRYNLAHALYAQTQKIRPVLLFSP